MPITEHLKHRIRLCLSHDEETENTIITICIWIRKYFQANGASYRVHALAESQVRRGQWGPRVLEHKQC